MRYISNDVIVTDCIDFLSRIPIVSLMFAKRCCNRVTHNLVGVASKMAKKSALVLKIRHRYGAATLMDIHE